MLSVTDTFVTRFCGNTSLPGSYVLNPCREPCRVRPHRIRSQLGDANCASCGVVYSVHGLRLVLLVGRRHSGSQCSVDGAQGLHGARWLTVVRIAHPHSLRTGCAGSSPGGWRWAALPDRHALCEEVARRFGNHAYCTRPRPRTRTNGHVRAHAHARPMCAMQ